MEAVRLRDLRRNAAELIRRAEEGAEIVITVSGRPAARLVPAAPRTWRRWSDVAALFDGPAAPACSDDQEAIVHDLQDPWAR